MRCRVARAITTHTRTRAYYSGTKLYALSGGSERGEKRALHRRPINKYLAATVVVVVYIVYNTRRRARSAAQIIIILINERRRRRRP